MALTLSPASESNALFKTPHGLRVQEGCGHVLECSGRQIPGWKWLRARQPLPMWCLRLAASRPPQGTPAASFLEGPARGPVALSGCGSLPVGHTMPGYRHGHGLNEPPFNARSRCAPAIKRIREFWCKDSESCSDGEKQAHTAPTRHRQKHSGEDGFQHGLHPRRASISPAAHWGAAAWSQKRPRHPRHPGRGQASTSLAQAPQVTTLPSDCPSPARGELLQGPPSVMTRSRHCCPFPHSPSPTAQLEAWGSGPQLRVGGGRCPPRHLHSPPAQPWSRSHHGWRRSVPQTLFFGL